MHRAALCCAPKRCRQYCKGLTSFERKWQEDNRLGKKPKADNLGRIWTTCVTGQNVRLSKISSAKGRHWPVTDEGQKSKH